MGENSDMKLMKKMLSKQLPAAMILCGLFALALPAADIVPFGDLTPAQAAELIKNESGDGSLKY